MTESVYTSQITDEQVYGETGRVWKEWTTILDRWDGEKTKLVPMVDYLMDYHYVRRFWAQIIAVYYRQKHAGTARHM